MKKVKLIYNPNAGDKSFCSSLDACTGIFQNAGYETHLLRLQPNLDLESEAECFRDYDLLVISGGDGTVNTLLNVLPPGNISVPIAIIPSGTANDFASHLKIPKLPEEAVTALLNGEIISSDMGIVNGRYFINVCGSGVFVNISELVDDSAKDTLGKYAYYLKGIEQLPGCIPFPIRIRTGGRVIEENVFMYFVLNSSGVGGLTNISPQASITDGVFELIAIKAMPVMELAMLFLKLRKGDIYDDNRILFLKGSSFYIENLSSDSQYAATGVDGEKGPDMPIEIKNLPGRIKLLVPKEG